MSSGSVPSRAARVVAMAAAAALTSCAFAYAAGLVGEPAPVRQSAADPISLRDNDNDQPLFSLTNMAPGQTASACIALTNESSVPVDITLNSTVTGSLADFLDLQVERGSGDPAAPGSCAAFAKDADVWSGLLRDFPSPDQTGITDAALAAGATRVYRYTASMRDDNAAQGLASDVSFDFNGTGEPPAIPAPTLPEVPIPTPGPGAGKAPTPAPDRLVPIPSRPGEACSSYHFLGGRVVRTTRRKRTRARLVISRVGRGKAQQLQLTTSLKGANGRKLPKKRWLRVEYWRDGKKIGMSQRRPFRVAIKPNALRTGLNKLQVRVRGRKGRTRTVKATFSLTIGKALLNGETVCVVKKQSRTGAASR
jgi:hypothetical protein